jgi:hypothetical protein
MGHGGNIEGIRQKYLIRSVAMYIIFADRAGNGTKVVISSGPIPKLRVIDQLSLYLHMYSRNLVGSQRFEGATGRAAC